MEHPEILAKMIDHSLLHPTLTDQELHEGCLLAKAHNVASVCIKPYAVAMAANWLKDSSVAVGTVTGFPHGNSSVAIKIAETEQACEDGATEIDMVVNVGKVLSEDWDYISQEIEGILKASHSHKALLKVIFENDFLEDHHIVRLCEICSELSVDFVKTSTGFGFVKDDGGKYFYRGATDHHLMLMRKYTAAHIEVKAAGGIRSLDDLLRVRDLGVTRVGATATQAILEAAKQIFSSTQ